MLKHITQFIWQLRLFRDQHAQDLVEYALLAGMLAAACGAMLGDVHDSVRQVFHRVNHLLQGRLHTYDH